MIFHLLYSAASIPVSRSQKLHWVNSFNGTTQLILLEKKVSAETIAKTGKRVGCDDTRWHFAERRDENDDGDKRGSSTAGGSVTGQYVSSPFNVSSRAAIYYGPMDLTARCNEQREEKDGRQKMRSEEKIYRRYLGRPAQPAFVPHCE